MATTKIWPVKGRLDQVVGYINNPSKTENPIDEVIAYATREDKTELKYFVSGINCFVNTATEEMWAVKKQFGKEDSFLAFHAYQSFAKDEVTPQMAHEIGIKLSKKLWGDRFQIVVATHLDKESHIHNHFVINSVSFIDGKRYYDNTGSYMNFRKMSDAICKEYGLSVIDNPKRGKSKHMGEYIAEKENRPTYRGELKKEIDRIIQDSMTMQQFFNNLKANGYDVLVGKDISVLAPGKERRLRLMRNFGEEYSYSNIQKKILENKYTYKKKKDPVNRSKHFSIIIKGIPKRRVGGLKGLYLHYCYLLGIIPKEPNKNKSSLLRDEVIKMDKIFKEMKLLARYHIDTYEQLLFYKTKFKEEFDSLFLERKSLKNKQKGTENRETISELTKKISKLRNEIRQIESIEIRSEKMKENLTLLHSQKNHIGKEKKTDAKFRRRS